jgi:hypothetical protein
MLLCQGFESIDYIYHYTSKANMAKMATHSLSGGVWAPLAIFTPLAK